MNNIHAVVLRGKRKGQVVTLHQYCNDWATLEDGSVASLVSLQLMLDAYYKFIEDYKFDRDSGTHRLGAMFTMFFDYEHFLMTMRFKRLRNKS